MAVAEELRPGAHLTRRVLGSPSARLTGRRLLAAIPVLWGVTFLTYAVMNLLPGDAARRRRSTRRAAAGSVPAARGPNSAARMKSRRCGRWRRGTSLPATSRWSRWHAPRSVRKKKSERPRDEDARPARAAPRRQLRPDPGHGPGDRGSRLRCLLPLGPLPGHRPGRHRLPPDRLVDHAGRPGRADRAGPPGHADDRVHLPAAGAAGGRRRHRGRDERRPGRTRRRRRLVRAGAPVLRHPVPAAGRAVRPARRAARGHHRAVADDAGGAVQLPRQALPARGVRQHPPAGPPPTSPPPFHSCHHRRRRAAAHAVAGRAVRRRVQQRDVGRAGRAVRQLPPGLRAGGAGSGGGPAVHYAAGVLRADPGRGRPPGRHPGRGRRADAADGRHRRPRRRPRPAGRAARRRRGHRLLPPLRRDGPGPRSGYSAARS